MQTVLDILYRVVVTPLIYVIELAFSVIYRLVPNPGLAIVGVSLVVNFLCLPLYAMADRTQALERQRQKDMSRWVSHIKRVFRGDEQYMMLSTYYRQQGYSPLSALKGSLSLLLQVPIFMAAYSYLSNLGILGGSSFMGIPDLGAPDGLLVLGGITVNVLPILMTLLNCVSTFVYTRDLGLRDKVQAYGLAALFLVLLYGSPSGLVLYWTCNQVFSIAKNVVLGKRGLALDASRDVGDRPLVITFVLASLLITVLVGLLVPSALISSSTAEFITVNSYVHPLRYLVGSVCVTFGFFVLWVGIYFFLSRRAGREALAGTLWMLAIVFMVDYFLFGQDLGIISSSLIFEQAPSYSRTDILMNLVAVFVVAASCYLAARRWRGMVNRVLAVLLVATVGLCVPNLVTIKDDTLEVKAEAEASGVTIARRGSAVPNPEFFDEQGDVKPLFSLSREGRNVVVVFLDRAIGAYVPMILNERPDLAERLDGFTFYPNTLSFGRFTIFGSPALYGGYDYSVEAMNVRSDELLENKHGEALLLMPTLFSQSGFAVTDINPPLVDYRFSSSSFELFDGLDNFSAYRLTGAYTDYLYHDLDDLIHQTFERNLVFYSLFKVAPVVLQPTIYDEGVYFSTAVNHAVKRTFLNNYSTLKALPLITAIDQGASDNFLVMGNDTTHEPDLLQLPSYEPSSFIDNEEDYSRFTVDGVTADMSTPELLSHYHANMAALLTLADWFDYLREQGAYDNTRIILVADHGAQFGQFQNLLFDDGQLDVEGVNPLLMVKDFDAHGFAISNEFMTNADTPTLALSGIVDDPVNPYTNNRITSDEKYAHDQLVNNSGHWDTTYQQGTTFDMTDGRWYRVHDDIFDPSCWTYVGE